MNWTQRGIAALSLIVVLFLITCGGAIWETNKAGEVQIKQAAISGEMSVKKEPGMYMQNFGKIWTYKISDKMDLEEVGTNPRFSDGSVAQLEGNIRWLLPSGEDALLNIHKHFRSYDNLRNDLIENTIREAIANTATMMVAEDSYSSRRAEFTALSLNQIEEGIYETVTKEVDSIDASGTKFKKKVTEVKYENGKPVIRKKSPLAQYGITISQFVITDFKYDDTITALINKKKEAEQLGVVAKANAEKAKNDAVTEQEQGKARVAKAEADALVVKKTAVIEAEKLAEVARLDALKAVEEAKAIKAKGDAEAAVAKQKVAAGLTPLERAQIEADRDVKIAEHMSKWKGPEIVMIGDSKGSNGMLDALTINQMMEVQKKLADKKE